MGRSEKCQIFRKKIGGKKINAEDPDQENALPGLKNFLSLKAFLGYDGEKVILFLESARTKHHPSWEGF
jgi:hypothetical protein